MLICTTSRGRRGVVQRYKNMLKSRANQAEQETEKVTFVSVLSHCKYVELGNGQQDSHLDAHVHVEILY